MWKLTSNEPKRRVYTNEKTNSTCETELIYTDEAGRKWWGFADLFKLPYIRIAYSKQISDLFSAGLTQADLQEWCNKEKALLRSKDAEKYEKLYAMVLEKEKLIEATVNPLKQHLSLCTVYVLGEHEKVDFYDLRQAEEKMKAWAQDTQAVAFFLSWHSSHMQSFTDNFNSISKIASNIKEISQQPTT